MASRKPARSLSSKGTVRVEGLRKLDRQLRKLGDAVHRKGTNEALLAAAEPVRAEAERLAPRSNEPGGSTGKGHAADHIEKIVAATNEEVHIGPESDFWYLVFAEFGVPAGTPGAQPMVAPFRRAADTKFKEAVTEFRRTMAARIARELQ